MDGDTLISEAAQRLSVSSRYPRLLVLRTRLSDPMEKPAGSKNEREGREAYRGEVRSCDGRKQPVQRDNCRRAEVQR
jgi:hypothetical protein